MHKRINRFTDFMSWLAKQYREIQEYAARNYPFRILEERRLPRTGETIFTVQFVGKSTCIKLTATELAEDDDLIHGFSPQDVKHIMQAALIKPKLSIIQGGLQKTPFRIVAKNFQREKQRFTYLIEQTLQDNETVTKAFDLEEVTRSKEMLLKFSKRDIYEIAYSAGAESVLKTEEEIKHLKQ